MENISRLIDLLRALGVKTLGAVFITKKFCNNVGVELLVAAVNHQRFSKYYPSII